MATATKPSMPASPDSALRGVSSRYGLNHYHICHALFRIEPHEINDAQYFRLMDSIRLLGEMKFNGRSLYSVSDAVEALSRAGARRREHFVRLSLHGLVNCGFIEVVEGRYRYKQGSVELAIGQFNKERAI
jgi:hypothetical protein